MDNEIDALRKRVQELENTALEYARLEHLINYAAQGKDLSRYVGAGVFYADAVTRQVVDANDALTDLLGYPRDQLLSMMVDDLEVSTGTPYSLQRTRDEDSVGAIVYPAVYQHHDGQRLAVTIHRYEVVRDQRRLLYYRLTDNSLQRRLWFELQRREDDGFKFQEKLTTLNEITVELSRIESFDALCLHVVKFGMERLGFDRIGLWLVDSGSGLMRGTYGVDEQGNIRDEHDQHWTYTGSQITEFIARQRDAALVFDQSPIYNDRSEIIGYGWVITVPVLNADRCLATLSADNYRRALPIKSYEPELLRLYGITVAHLMELSRSREQAIALRVADERAHMLREFIGSVGHDVRNPLAVINTKAYLIDRVADADRRHALVLSIQEQVKHISAILDSARDFITLQNQPALQLKRTEIAALLTDVIDAHRAASAAKNLHVEAGIDGSPALNADAELLNRALSEIFDNAVLYTPQDGWVRVTCVSDPQQITIRVQDSGVGMEPGVAARAFDPFYRSDKARTERHSGLGLPIAKVIVEAHGGRIDVISAPGQGSTFEITLPLRLT
jgi:signal transduction histidine kinase